MTVLAAGVEAALDVQRLPRRAFLVLGEAERHLAGVALRGAIDAAGPAAADVADDELQRAPDRGVRPVALAEDVDAGVHADLPADRPVDDEHRTHRHRRREQTVDVELVRARGLEGREHDGQVLGCATGEHRVDRHLLDGALHEIGRNECDDLVWRACRAFEHAQDALGRRRHDGKAVGPAPVEQRLHLVFEVGEVDSSRVQTMALEPRPQPVDERGIDRQRTAAGPVVGQVGSEAGDAGEALPLVAPPAHDALGLQPIVADVDQRRHRLDVVVVREVELGVELDVVDARWKGGVVLREHDELDVGGGVELVQHRLDE